MIAAVRNLAAREPLGFIALLTLAATTARVIILGSTPLNLGPDEAQYWSWSLTPAFGYFSKPPMIAWLIGATTGVCGDGEACIRLSAPLIHAGTTLLVFLAARTLYDARVGFWSALTYLLMPGTTFSSLLITTDVPLLFCWALALLAIARLRTDAAPSPAWGATLGIALGLGMLSKYAILYFALGVGIALLPSANGRRIVFSRAGLAAIALMLLLVAPNIVWNMTHGFATVRHTASNANWGSASLFNLMGALNFLGAQAGIIGPVAAGLFCWGLVRVRDRSWNSPDTLLLALSIPIIAIVTLQAFISRANANWAAPAYIAVTILVCAWALRSGKLRILAASTVLNAALAVLLAALAVSPAFVAAIGQENSVKRLRGWEDAGNRIAAMADAGPFTAIVSDDREDMASLFYYTRSRGIPLRMWPTANPGNEYEASYALKPEEASRILFITRRTDISTVIRSVASHEQIATITTQLDSKRNRTFFVYELSGPVSAATFPEK